MSLSRRSFLAASAAAVAAPALLAKSHAAPDPWGGFTVGAQTYTFRKFPLERMLKTCQQLGIRYAEFYNGHISPISKPEAVKAYLKQCSDFDVKPVAFGVERFTKDHDKNKKLFEFGKNLGVKSLSADPDPDSLDSLDKLVEEYKIAIAIHPHGPSGKSMHRWKDAEMIMKTVKSHHPLIGTCLDTGHLIRSAQLGYNFDIVKQIEIMGARNFGFHLKDHDNKRKTDVPFGDKTGVLDVLAVLKALKKENFKGYIAIEYEAHEDNPTDDVKLCLDYFKEQVKKLS
ncbi:MAG: sugar phosphate isomerase/epimerase [Gemmataceae bacterium]